jgi:hypothetical protein
VSPVPVARPKIIFNVVKAIVSTTSSQFAFGINVWAIEGNVFFTFFVAAPYEQNTKYSTKKGASSLLWG